MDFTPVQDQMSAEWRNHAVYSKIAATLYAAKWDGFAHYFERQAAEEQEHYQKFRDYLIDRLQVPALVALPLPDMPDGNFPALFFKMAYDLEKANTAAILALDAMNEETEADPERELLETFLIPLKDEQRISERNASDSIVEIGRVVNDPAGMVLMDERYGGK